MTAIAAVLALTSPPALAQTAETPPAAPTPVVETTGETPPVTTTTADPLAPTTSAPVEETAPAETTATTEAPAAAAPAPVARSNRPARTVSRQAAAAPAPRTAAPVAQEAPAPAPVPAEAPMAPPQPLAAASAPAAAAPVANPVAAQDPTINDMLPIAGAAGLGALALLGAGLVIRRRRRREDEAHEEYEVTSWDRDEDVAPQPTAEPAFARSEPVRPIHDPTPMLSPAMAAAATKLPNGFDISKFGRHVQAAYRGPTKDNPSLSLKNRLRRASFFDQREREAGFASRAPEPMPAVISAPAVQQRQPEPGLVTARVSPNTGREKRPAPAFRPAYQF
ncbi:hypothetical protein [Sphingomonas sp. LY160]|uniref:hypothetical protein n=1 Tax=Sphingomonas sp. LY160 TaxID=3095342 RepID=UPI002ADEC55B|nr:hypothetical protein [Sphingomonas sp. LY160]MEA1072479.1 hypothetical protein [Sphingomonas sp. LY160]